MGLNATSLAYGDCLWPCHADVRVQNQIYGTVKVPHFDKAFQKLSIIHAYYSCQA